MREEAKRDLDVEIEYSFGIGLYSYGYLPNGERVLVSNTPEQVAAFIMAHPNESVKIVNIFDMLEIETSMGFLMNVPNQQFLAQELLPVLVPMQQGEAEIIEFIPYKDEAYIIKNVRMETEEGNFYLVNLDYFRKEVERISDGFQSEEDLMREHPNSISEKEADKIASEKDFI